MPVSYKAPDRRKKGYSFKDGKLHLGNEVQNYGPQPKPNASPVDKAGLISDRKEKRAEQGWKVENEDGTKTDVGSPNQEPKQDYNNIDFNQPIDPSQMSTDQIKALQKKIGAGADGKWGPGSQNQLNKYYAFEGIEPPNAKKLGSVLKDMGAVIKEKPDNYDTIGGKRPAYATNELSSGGDVSPELIEAVDTSLRALEVPGLRVTAGNDAYHQGDRYSKPGKGAHSKGKALDFTTDDPEAVRQAMLDQGWKKKETKKYTWYVSPNGKYRILDEYAKATVNTTGGHFDLKVY